MATTGVVNWKAPRDAPFGDSLTSNVQVGVLIGRAVSEVMQ